MGNHQQNKHKAQHHKEQREEPTTRLKTPQEEGYENQLLPLAPNCTSLAAMNRVLFSTGKTHGSSSTEMLVLQNKEQNLV